MRIIITEEMRFRQKVVEYAIKHKNNAKAARRYDTSRQQVQRWRKKYNGTVESLANKSRRPHSHPNEHTQKEIELISKKYQYHKHEGLGQVYRKCKESGESKVLLFSLSGHGLIDMTAYESYLSGDLRNYTISDEDIAQSLQNVPQVPMK